MPRGAWEREVCKVDDSILSISGVAIDAYPFLASVSAYDAVGFRQGPPHISVWDFYAFSTLRFVDLLSVFLTSV